MTRRAGMGFTLIEVLVTILILGMLLTLLYGVLVTTLDSKQRVEALSMREKVRSGIVRLFSRDLRAVYTYAMESAPALSSTLPDEEEGSEEPEEREEQSEEVQPPSPEEEGALPRIEGAFTGKDRGDIDFLSFLSSVDLDGSPDGDVQPSAFSRIHYALQPSEEIGLYTLFRGVEPYSFEDGSTSDARYAEVYDRIVVFDLEYLGESDWERSWSSPEPPRAVRLTLDFRVPADDPDREPTPFVAVITIPSS